MFSRLLRRFSVFEEPKQRNMGREAVDGIDHRDYVGGRWDELGSLQLTFLRKHGLKANHVLLDIGCGSMRAGRKLIPYLEKKNYLGIDARPELIEAGIEVELGAELCRQREPEFVVSDKFEFSRFSKRPDFAIAQAVFIHLTDEQILLCMNNLRSFSNPWTKLYATYLESAAPKRIESDMHPHLIFYHTREQMMNFGKLSGWRARYIGNWKHPRGQVMVEYVLAV